MECNNSYSDDISGMTGVFSLTYSLDEPEMKEAIGNGFEALRELMYKKLKESGFSGDEPVSPTGIVGITGIIGCTGIVGDTGIIGAQEDLVNNQDIGYTGLQELLKRVASGTCTSQDKFLYFNAIEGATTIEELEEIENLSLIWMLKPLKYGNCDIKYSIPNPSVDFKKQKLSFKIVKGLVAELLITLGHYLKGEVKYQQTQIIKLFVDCKKCEGLGFKKKLFSKKFDKGTVAYKETFRPCKHCNSNGKVLKDISKKSVQYIQKVTKGKKRCVEGTLEMYQ
jgi:hypothetical protein